jgi:hypothetical protein
LTLPVNSNEESAEAEAPTLHVRGRVAEAGADEDWDADFEEPTPRPSPATGLLSSSCLLLSALSLFLRCLFLSASMHSRYEAPPLLQPSVLDLKKFAELPAVHSSPRTYLVSDRILRTNMTESHQVGKESNEDEAVIPCRFEAELAIAVANETHDVHADDAALAQAEPA